MKTKTYFHGDGHSKWGIWNNMRKEFQFGICEDTPLLAERKLRQKIGNDARKWRFEVKQLPCATRKKARYRMEIKKLTEYKGASRFGNCIECGEMESDKHRLYRLQFKGVSICLCPDCFRTVRAKMNDAILDGYIGKAESEG